MLQLEMLERATLGVDGIFLCYNALSVYLFVGAQADPSLIATLFKVDQFGEINMLITEEEIFADVEEQPYLTALYSLINQVRY